MKKLYHVIILCLLGYANSALSAAIDWQHTMTTPMRSDWVGASATGPNDTTFIGGDAHFMFMGNNDYFVAKMDASGNVLWHKTYGGSDQEAVTALAALPDGGVLVAGQSRSGISGDKTQPVVGPNQAAEDYWLLRLDSAGNILWDKTLGGFDYEQLNAITLTNDGNFVIAGSTRSSNSGDKTGVNRNPTGSTYDIWALKLDLSGNVIWQKTIGGAGHDSAGYSALTATQNGGVILAGSSESGIGGEKSQASKGSHDYWVMKLDTHGTIIWDKTLGGSGGDFLKDAIQLRNGNIILGGISYSPISGDKTAPTFNGSSDYWIVALNSAGLKLWDKTYGGNDSDTLKSLTQTLDDGILVAGDSKSAATGNKTASGQGNDDYWIIKLNAFGQEQWQQVIGASGSDWFTSTSILTDGSLVLAGTSNSPADGDKTTATTSFGDAWVVKISEPLAGVSAFHFEDPYGQANTFFNCAGWDIYLNGAASQNEHNFYVDAWRRPINSSQPFNWQATIGWTAETAGLVNLTSRFAAILPIPYVFDPGYEYQIKLAVQNTTHFAWVETVHTFVIPAQLNYCSLPSSLSHSRR